MEGNTSHESPLKKSQILHINFNQEQGFVRRNNYFILNRNLDCFAFALETGFKVFTTSPFKQSIDRGH